MKRVAIIDYGLCNLDSISRAVEECGGRSMVTDNPKDLDDADAVILPGVGSFKDAMANLRAAKLDEAMGERVIGNGVPFLGICLGMQLMACNGTEGGAVAGLGWIDGDICRLKTVQPQERIPHVGWNEVMPEQDSPLFTGIDHGSDFYFVHGYHFDAAKETDVAARTPYCGRFVSSVCRQNLFGVQFHPEKSQKNGFRLLTNFLNL